MQIQVIDDCSTNQPQNVGYIRNFETCLLRSRGQLIHLLHSHDCVKDGFYRQMQSAFKENSEIGI
jgi:hypothetical protein